MSTTSARGATDRQPSELSCPGVPATEGCGEAPAAEGCGEGPGGDLGWALVTVLRAHVRAADLVLSDLPGGPRAYRLLAAVSEQRHASQLALADAVGLDRTVVTYLLDGLVREGLVERQADPHDRRARRIVLTPLGETRLAGFTGRLDQVERHVLTGLDEQEAATLRNLLDRTAQAVRGLDPTTCRDVAELSGTEGGC